MSNRELYAAVTQSSGCSGECTMEWDGAALPSGRWKRKGGGCSDGCECDDSGLNPTGGIRDKSVGCVKAAPVSTTPGTPGGLTPLPSAPTGACCINGNCTITTQAACTGVWKPNTLCNPNPCGVSQPPPNVQPDAPIPVPPPPPPTDCNSFTCTWEYLPVFSTDPNGPHQWKQTGYCGEYHTKCNCPIPIGPCSPAIPAPPSPGGALAEFFDLDGVYVTVGADTDVVLWNAIVKITSPCKNKENMKRLEVLNMKRGLANLSFCNTYKKPTVPFF